VLSRLGSAPQTLRGRQRRPLVAALLALCCTKLSPSHSLDSGLMCGELPDQSKLGGKRKRSEIERKLDQHAGALEACYRRALSHDPKAAGRVETRLVIDPDGSVSSACIQKTTLNDGDAVACMLDEFRAIRFGPGKGSMTVVYPLSYSPG
jgi:hypothetical protein